MPLPGPSPKFLPNVVMFGETGTGKSSLVNMLAGRNIAGVSNRAVGGTFSSDSYEVFLNTITYKIWDTAGLNEGIHGSVPAEIALQNLRILVGKMSEGINLLVYCVRGTRFREILKFNYDMFYKIICQGEVPIVIVVTGLEYESPMDAWWEANRAEFGKYGLAFQACACVTATRGKDGMFDEEFEESKKKVEQLIVKNCSEVPGKVDRQRWNQVVEKMQEYQDRYNMRVPEDVALADPRRTSNPLGRSSFLGLRARACVLVGAVVWVGAYAAYAVVSMCGYRVKSSKRPDLV
ncbi:hypothetical protein NLJ89_g5169 [Agrocybe chaxingu]|uniref:G domain-containing protein n=1 Tax=Agrocybe chaxingu TaxID=84603 RepID=A0A9W8K1N0_9AGAR|nr:hypothetical protein NLJ89_g5169 [Agrocybe chaxingu]